MGRTNVGDVKSKRSRWERLFISNIHCGAGCVLGDIIGEWGVFLLGLTFWGSMLLTAYVVDFALALVIGTAILYFTIKPIQNLTSFETVKKAIKNGTFVLTAFEVGMFGWMALLSLVIFKPLPEPTTAVYWFMMQLGMMIGLLTAYPACWLMVESGSGEHAVVSR